MRTRAAIGVKRRQSRLNFTCHRLSFPRAFAPAPLSETRSLRKSNQNGEPIETAATVRNQPRKCRPASEDHALPNAS
jgi:hypothetical protein